MPTQNFVNQYLLTLTFSNQPIHSEIYPKHCINPKIKRRKRLKSAPRLKLKKRSLAEMLKILITFGVVKISKGVT